MAQGRGLCGQAQDVTLHEHKLGVVALAVLRRGVKLWLMIVRCVCMAMQTLDALKLAYLLVSCAVLSVNAWLRRCFTTRVYGACCSDTAGNPSACRGQR